MTTPPSPKIRILDPVTINQIAAGEVVERPASVVKELVENSVDAGSGTITISLTTTKEGIASIRVTDDGCGMSPADAELAFVPHATSKITSLSDLHRITTLGFRGEALATIASVARVTLTTKEDDSGAVPGTRIVLEGGILLEKKNTGAPDGTSILVENLFFNTPARKKFQKSRTTELAHIHDVMEGICLAHPGIAFHLLQDGHELLVTDRTPTPLDTIARVFGSGIIADLLPIRFTSSLLSCQGFIGRPSLTRKDRARMLVSVNGRFVNSPAINDAIKGGYGTLLPKDRFPVAFLNLTLDTERVDVNVHPTKKEIRLSGESEITTVLRDSVTRTLLTNDLIPSVSPPLPAPGTKHVSSGALQQGYDHSPAPHPPVVFECSHSGTISTDQRLRQTELIVDIDLSGPDTGLLPEIDVIGEFGGIYILGRTPADELLIIDQHAAHERILYEQVCRRSEESGEKQDLISPVLLHRTQKETVLIRELRPLLAAEGFVLDEFGTGSFLVRSVPVILGRMEDAACIEDIVSDLLSDEKALRVSPRERILRVIACRGAVKAGTVCSAEQCRRIIGQLRRTQNPFTCPHGRPTILRFSRRDLDAMFKRV